MFKKIVLIIIGVTSLGFAKDSFSSDRFIGVEAGYNSIKSTNIIGIQESTKGVEFGFRVGAQNKEWRTTLSGHAFNKNSIKYFRGILTFDRFIWASLYKTDNIVFKPYLGGHAGWMKYSSRGVEDNGFLYGVQAGVAWNVLKEVDFDLGYRYSFSDVSTISDLGGFVFAVNYLY